jgi:hypothetical protein
MGRPSQTTTTQAMPAFQEQFLSQTLLPFATNISEQEFTPYGGEMTAGVSDTTMMALPQFQRIADIAAMTPADYAAMTRENYNPYQTDVIDASVARAAREREISRVGEQAELAKLHAPAKFPTSTAWRSGVCCWRCPSGLRDDDRNKKTGLH